MCSIHRCISTNDQVRRCAMDAVQEMCEGWHRSPEEGRLWVHGPRPSRQEMCSFLTWGQPSSSLSLLFWILFAFLFPDLGPTTGTPIVQCLLLPSLYTFSFVYWDCCSLSPSKAEVHPVAAQPPLINQPPRPVSPQEEHRQLQVTPRGPWLGPRIPTLAQVTKSSEGITLELFKYLQPVSFFEADYPAHSLVRPFTSLFFLSHSFCPSQRGLPWRYLGILAHVAGPAGGDGMYFSSWHFGLIRCPLCRRVESGPCQAGCSIGEPCRQRYKPDV